MNRVFVLVLLLCAASFAADKPFVRVRWKGSELRVTYKNKLMTYDYGDLRKQQGFNLYAIDKVTTDYLAETNALIYMILDVRGPSRGPQDSMRECGAGTEAAKILFVFDSGTQAKTPEIALYESCYHNVESDLDGSDTPSNDHAFTVARFETYSARSTNNVLITSVTKKFDPQHPENGFVTKETCSERKPSDAADEAKTIPCPK